ncbi:MAG TPA: hypothetical protein VFP94_05180 [Terriglobales bacterium]|nr:hypothetical protein [Terriglobales bacterium]
MPVPQSDFVSKALRALAARLFPCRHAHELFDRYPDGRPALRCRDCFQLRPNILADATPQYRLTQPVALPPLAHATGIQRAWGELDFPITDADLFDLSETPTLVQ